MSTALVDGDLVQTRTWFTDGDQAAVCTFNWIYTASGGVQITDQDVCNQMDTDLASIWITILNDLATYNGVQASIVNRDTPIAGVFQTAGAASGTGGASAAARQTCGLISFQTPLAGPKYRGRMYLPFPSVQLDSGSGSPNSTYLTIAGSIRAYLAQTHFISVSGRTGTIAPVVLHRAKRPVMPTSTLIVAGTVSSRWATQRKRGAFGKPNSSPI